MKSKVTEVTPEDIERCKKEYPGSFELADGVIDDELIAKTLMEFEKMPKDDLYALTLSYMVREAIKMAAMDSLGVLVKEVLGKSSDDEPSTNQKPKYDA